MPPMKIVLRYNSIVGRGWNQMKDDEPVLFHDERQFFPDFIR